MKTKTILAALSLAPLLALAAPATAQPFQGPYVGAQAGGTHDSVGRGAIGDLTRGDRQGSFTGGGFAGYDFKLSPRVVVGGEAGVNFTSGDTLYGASGPDSVTIDPKRQIDLTARVGYLVEPKTLFYVRGGYTNVRADVAVAGARGAGDNLDGWTLGAGAERYLTDTVSTRLEYRYSDLSQGDGKYDRQQVLLGVAYHF
jgi:outer membrane immunogenic protein